MGRSVAVWSCPCGFGGEKSEVDRHVRSCEICKEAKKRDEDFKIMIELVDLAGKLSPENLHEDGEISNAQAMKKYKVLKLRWLALEKKLGRGISEGEVWNWYIENQRRR